MTVSTFFTQTLHVLRTTESRDAIGGVAASTLSDTEVLGYIEPVTGQEDLANRNTLIGEWLAYLPLSTDVSSQDRLGFQARVFDIDSVEPFEHPVSPGLDHIRLRLREVT